MKFEYPEAIQQLLVTLFHHPYMFKRLLIFLLVFQLVNPARAQFDTAFVKSRIQLCADSMVLGFRAKNWELYTRYTYPALIGSLGGKEAFIKYVSESFSSLPDSAWKKYETGNVLQIVKTAGDLQAIIELHMILEWQQMRIITTHHLIAESWDGGMYWTFFDSQNDLASSALIKPDISPSLIIPKRIEKVESLH